MIDYIELVNKLNSLSLDGFVQLLPKIIERLNNNEITFFEALNKLTDNQIMVKKEKVYKAGIKVSHFPSMKTLPDFDF